MKVATDKGLIRQQFGKNIDTYDKTASVQLQVSKELVRALKPLMPFYAGKVFEIGSGTGFLTKGIMNQTKPDYYWINDLVSEAKSKAEKVFEEHQFTNWQFIEGDAEALDFPKGLDLILSSSAIQWFDDFESFAQKADRVLKPGGILAFTTFGPSTYREIQSLLNKGLEYLSLQEHLCMLGQSFNIEYQKEEIREMVFDTPIEVLRHIKAIGANGLDKEYWGKEKFREFEAKYQQAFSKAGQGVKLTYHPMIIICKK